MFNLNKYKPFTLITIYSSTLKTEYCYLHDDNHQVEGYVQLEISNGLMILTLESGKQVTINLYNIQYFTYKNQSGAKMLEFYM